MGELDLEVPIERLNDIMTPITRADLYLKWVFYNDIRGTASLRIVVPEDLIEEVLFMMAKAYGGPLEVSVIRDEGRMLVGQAFLNSVHVNAKSYPVVVLMDYSSEHGPYVPVRVAVITKGDIPEGDIEMILSLYFKDFKLMNSHMRGTVERNSLTKIIMIPSS
ncbi:MAG: hypothetical protein J7K48_04125 [Thermococcus sp.]|uniref:Uncharacterized protein n=1 Tax=Thermococcus guaymasensis DSM 11113 TaxID=1432656 RepID=A0A0X1KI81_9EURY|nr:hypothetical protein [Thermococcus guaymasensis]AJC70965.1 hypothetical protein X802_01280 [Thermococcus guaymasensis DSM 11113]MCD6524168.1 hypothetical protein [Thermococcus sp.]